MMKIYYLEDDNELYVKVGSIEYHFDKNAKEEEYMYINQDVTDSDPDTPGIRIVDTDHDTLSVCFASELGRVQVAEIKRRKKR